MTLPVVASKIANLQLVLTDQNGATASFDCVNHQQSFAINKIPLASCTVAVGLNVQQQTVALIHQAAQGIQFMTRARVIADIQGYWGSANRPGDRPGDPGLWSLAGPQVIFDGYVTGVSQQRAPGRYIFSIQLIHWLADLAFSSIFSEESHPENPSKYSNFASYSAFASAATRPHFLAGRRFSQNFTPSNIQADLWGRAIGQTFCQIAQEPLTQIGSPACSGGTRRNDLALAALNRIEGLSGKWGNTPYVYGKPLSMGGLGSIGTLVAKAINRYVGGQTTASWWHTTLWDKLVGDLGPAFMCHLVPRVQSAIVAPFVPGLNVFWTSIVDASEISGISLGSFVRRPIRAVGIYAGIEFGTAGSPGGAAGVIRDIGIGGCFMPDPDARGTVLIRRAPGWLSTIPALASSPTKTIMGGRSRGATGSMLTPISAGNLRGDASGKTSTTVGSDSGELYARLARYVYVTEMLRGRTGTLTGKLRFDIAPGSNVVVFNEARGGALRPRISPLSFSATVTRVESVLDAEQQQAGTTLHLAHVRNANEQNDPQGRYSLDAHPLYDQRFVGSPLVDAYNFFSV